MKILLGEIPPNPYSNTFINGKDCIHEEKIFNNGQQSILSQAVEVDLDKLADKWFEIELYHSRHDPTHYQPFTDYLKEKLGQKAILNKVDTTWKNKPDSEGWWWYKFGINLMCLKLHKNPFGYLYYFDSGETWGIEDHAGKWQKAILPQELGE